MDFTILIIGLIIGVGIPIRNKAIKEYRKNKHKYNENKLRRVNMEGTGRGKA